MEEHGKQVPLSTYWVVYQLLQSLMNFCYGKHVLPEKCY